MKRAEPDGEDRQFKKRRTLGGLSGSSVTPPWGERQKSASGSDTFPFFKRLAIRTRTA
ncbi:hypothetical protein FHT00_000099 [Sphingomonas insulae]|nr:hypothetical protein [Sphingomonas insulae]